MGKIAYFADEKMAECGDMRHFATNTRKVVVE
jgi:hypothetical protein